MLTYTDLVLLETFEERLDFLKLPGVPSELTFDSLRYLNQRFYNSKQWRDVRYEVIARDLGCDLAIPGRDIFSRPVVHHMNPIKPKDVIYNIELCLDPELLITVSDLTHRSIHFNTPQHEPTVERFEGDTKLW